MPRQSRIDAPGALNHIVIRGIERKAIFKDDLDYQNFLKRLGKIFLETSTSCYAWALLKNHVHLLLRTGRVPISTVMRRLLTGYAQQFNRRYRRHGHLFQNRYKSILCEEDPYLLELVRYIHLNPVRAGIVKDIKGLSKYWKCGHSALMGKRKNEWQDTDYILALFDKKIVSARRYYSDFVKKGITQGPRLDLVGGGLLRSVGGWAALNAMRSVGLRIMGDERILGSGDFVENVLKQANEEYEKKTLAKARGLDLNTLIDAAAKHFDIDSEILKGSSKQRTVSRARSIICYLAINKMGISGATIARRLMLSPSTVSKSAVRGQIDRLTKQIENEIFDDSK